MIGLPPKPCPMENLLVGLDESSDVLSAEELQQELAARGINAVAVIAELEELYQQPPPNAAQEQDAREMGFLPEKESQK